MIQEPVGEPLKVGLHDQTLHYKVVENWDERIFQMTVMLLCLLAWTPELLELSSRSTS